MPPIAGSCVATFYFLLIDRDGWFYVYFATKKKRLRNK